ncbi:mediator of RNA polymerase II transcription subunit 29-like [Ptychodera flava]|uniref:mediator of RNA polymerase II transcription subunit 29-like n=1 Tax=Ptychodera flava TaxID=63121 RepID=UPI00396AA880
MATSQQSSQNDPLQQSQQSQQQSQQQQQQQQPIDDPTSKVKMLVPHLRESLVNLMKITSHNFVNYAGIDNASKSENPSQRLDKSLEEFYSICDQIELNLRLAREYMVQSGESAHHTPVAIWAPKTEAGQMDTLQNYGMYINTVKTQITYAKDIHDLLQEWCKRLGSSTVIEK